VIKAGGIMTLTRYVNPKNVVKRKLDVVFYTQEIRSSSCMIWRCVRQLCFMAAPAGWDPAARADHFENGVLKKVLSVS